MPNTTKTPTLVIQLAQEITRLAVFHIEVDLTYDEQTKSYTLQCSVENEGIVEVTLCRHLGLSLEQVVYILIGMDTLVEDVRASELLAKLNKDL